MMYLITPPKTHYDSGLGVTASHFSQAADVLDKHGDTLTGVLPVCYLYRHAIELFLKSMIVILHKKFDIPYGDAFNAERPAIQVGTKWISLSCTHQLNDLFSYFRDLLQSLTVSMPATTDWKIPDDIEEKIKLISGSDPKSTYFRYPESTTAVQDAKKFMIQEESVEALLESVNASKQSVKCLLMLDENDNVVESYNINSSPIPHIIETLKYLNDFLYAFHAAIRGEITSGF